MPDVAPRVGRAKKFAPIHSDAAYPLPVFHRSTGLGEAAVRSARGRGLKVRYCGSRAYILGADFLEYLATCPTTPDAGT